MKTETEESLRSSVNHENGKQEVGEPYFIIHIFEKLNGFPYKVL